MATLDLVSRIPDALGRKDRKVVRTSVRSNPTYNIRKVLKDDLGRDLDLRVRIGTSGTGLLRISSIELTMHTFLWAALDIDQIDFLAEGMMLSDAIREIVRVLRPASAETLAVLSATSDGTPLDKAFLSLVGCAFGLDPMATLFLGSNQGDKILSSTDLATARMRYVPSRSKKMNLDGKPRTMISREYHPIANSRQYLKFEYYAIPPLISGIGDYAFIAEMQGSNYVTVISESNLQSPYQQDSYDPVELMKAAADLTALHATFTSESTR